ncbi:outer membrane protein transport protein [Sulfuricurvum sp.]|uniref:OmpP1/FadL family transporter n=2 Tax=Sulfuricurvum sp. TaxID=2025608 RepID=UPI00260316DE|nr:outer membrane protein transport protein [Sulfuricurvum sp.]MDD3598318.1 outer membrane protein transport protein [Sulfuricurvum sp.]MDD4884890.1 outer membrane protein transport protein [Sulfuricurvum sp.]
MKRSIKIAVAAAVALSATSAFATNGDAMIGVGAKAVGMGGVGIGVSHGAESALTNPAMITSVTGTEVSFGGTIFMPDVKTTVAGSLGSPEGDSDADLSVIPTVAVAQKATDNFYWGVGMYGVAGMGTDYRGTDTNYNMMTNLQLMQFVLPLAYKANGFSFAVAPILQYGSLDINYDTTYAGGTRSSTQGVAQDFGLGYTVGAAYEVDGLTVGASYKSAIDMNYNGQISQAMSDFTGAPASMFSDDLEQPAEMGVGISYVFGGNTIALDYKKIKWSDAKGYKDFKWEDQNVIMLGYQYAQDNWALRAGYNHATSPIKDQGYAGTLINIMNELGFPAIIEDHYTVGGSYAFTKMTSLDLAYVYSPEVTDEYGIMVQTGPLPTDVTPSTIKTSHSQQAVTVQLNFNF